MAHLLSVKVNYALKTANGGSPIEAVEYEVSC